MEIERFLCRRNRLSDGVLRARFKTTRTVPSGESAILWLGPVGSGLASKLTHHAPSLSTRPNPRESTSKSGGAIRRDVGLSRVTTLSHRRVPRNRGNGCGLDVLEVDRLRAGLLPLAVAGALTDANEFHPRRVRTPLLKKSSHTVPLWIHTRSSHVR